MFPAFVRFSHSFGRVPRPTFSNSNLAPRSQKLAYIRRRSNGSQALCHSRVAAAVQPEGRFDDGGGMMRITRRFGMVAWRVAVPAPFCVPCQERSVFPNSRSSLREKKVAHESAVLLNELATVTKATVCESHGVECAIAIAASRPADVPKRCQELLGSRHARPSRRAAACHTAARRVRLR